MGHVQQQGYPTPVRTIMLEKYRFHSMLFDGHLFSVLEVDSIDRCLFGRVTCDDDLLDFIAPALLGVRQ